jgi:putative transposase
MSRPLDETALATLSEADRAEAHRRWLLLRAHLDDGVPLTQVAAQSGTPHRTLRRWLARYHAGGLAGLARAARADRGRSRFPEPLRLLVEGLALRTPVPSTAHVHRQVAAVAEREGWPAPSYSTVYAIRGIDPALRTLAVEGAKRYAAVFELVYRRQASRPNEIWQADHTQLDLWVVTPAGKPARPWLTVIEDDHSRAIAGCGQPRRAVGDADRPGPTAGVRAPPYRNAHRVQAAGGGQPAGVLLDHGERGRLEALGG